MNKRNLSFPKLPFLSQLGQKTAIVFPYIFILFLCLVLLSGLFLPVYSDEVVTKWTVARFFEEPGFSVSLFPQCSKMLGRAIPFIFYPATLIYSSIYKNLALLGLRISGLVFAFLWLAGVAFWCFKSIK